MSHKIPLEKLISTHYGRIRRAAGLLSGCDWDADDLTQETFVRAAEAWHRFRGDSDEFVWLYGILLNLDRSRRRRVTRWMRHQRILLTRLVDGAATDSGTPGDTEIWQLIRRLPALRRQAIVLRYAEGWSYAEIAAVCCCEESTARTRVHKGLRTLREMLVPHHGDATQALATIQRPATG